MIRIHPIIWGLIWSTIIAIITWFTFVGVMHELPLSPRLQVLFYIHYPEVPANRVLQHIFHPSPDRFWIIGAPVHFAYWLSIGSIVAVIYSKLMGRRSGRTYDTPA